MVFAGKKNRVVDSSVKPEDSTGAPKRDYEVAPPRWLRNLLVLISIAAGVLMLYFGSIARIEYDGWWHVFIARTSDWSMFWREVYANAHPFLFFVFLKFGSFCLGFSRLAYRSVSILSGVFSVFLIGLIVQKICRERMTPILAAMVFATSTTTVIIANEVRSYMLAGVFFLFSLYFFLDVIEPGSNRLRSRFFCGAGLVLGVVSHYSLMFIIPVFAVVPLVLMVGDADYRAKTLRGWKGSLTTYLIMLGVPAAVAIEEYYFHIRKLGGSAKYVYLSRFYYESGEGLWAYVWRVLVDEINLFVPINLLRTPEVIQVFAVVVLVVGLAVLFRFLRKEGDARAAVVPIVTVVLVCVLLVVSIQGRYPFGGPLRHQYLVYLVALVSFFLFYDRCLIRLSSRPGRVVVQGLFLAVLIFSTGYQWLTLKIPRDELGIQAHQMFKDEFPDSSCVYLDQYSLIHFFTNEHRATWNFEKTTEDNRIDQIRVQKGDREFVILRDRRWQAHPDRAKVYRDLRSAMEEFGHDQVDIYHRDRVPRGSALRPRQRRESDPLRLEELGKQFGFTLTKVVRPRRGVFVRFELNE
ncbi:MAG: hypothetical protein DRJ65_05080 [Acidobacteria bacterium]|nr:MAG: hypothetical protein DRJ65_05080 [Acidobacteriota bacterium]